MTRHPVRAKMVPAFLTALLAVIAFAVQTPAIYAETLYTISPQTITDWKSVYGRIEPRRMVPARARLGGTLETLEINEGDTVEAGQVLGRVADVSLQFRLEANQSQLEALQSQLANAQTELSRGEELLERGVTSVQRIDTLRTQVEVLQNQIAAAEAEVRVSLIPGHGFQ